MSFTTNRTICDCPIRAISKHPLGINFAGSTNRPSFLMTQSFLYATRIRTSQGQPGARRTAYANRQLNPFGSWESSPGGSMAPIRNTF